MITYLLNVDVEKAIIKSIEELKEMVSELRTSQTQLNGKLDHLLRFTGAVANSVDLPAEITLPITNLQQFDSFNQQMQEAQLKQIVVSCQ